MIIYEVNLCISKSISDQFLIWLPAHIEEILSLPGFISAQTFNDQELKANNINMVVHYKVQDLESLESYIQEHSIRLKQQTMDLFGKDISAKRRILKKN